MSIEEKGKKTTEINTSMFDVLHSEVELLLSKTYQFSK